MSTVLYIPGLGPIDILTEAGRIPLALLCANLAGELRFGGFTNLDINVAQHSLACGQYVQHHGGSPEEIRAALLHDLPEGVGLRDLPSPIKQVLPAYAELERSVLAQLQDAHGFDLERYTMWREADHEILLAEQVLCQGRENIEADREAVRIVSVVLQAIPQGNRRAVGAALTDTINSYMVARASYDA